MEVIVVGIFFLFSAYVIYKGYQILKAGCVFEGLLNKENSREKE